MGVQALILCAAPIWWRAARTAAGISASAEVFSVSRADNCNISWCREDEIVIHGINIEADTRKGKLMNTFLHAIYDDASEAEQATQKLLGMGIARDSVLVITAAIANSPEGRAHMGSFADSGEHMHNAERDHIGSFADSGEHMHNAERDHVGSFADSGTHMHSTERDRVGSFADSASATLNVDLVGDLVRTGLSQDDAQAAAARLTKGAALLLARVDGDAATQVELILQAAT